MAETRTTQMTIIVEVVGAGLVRAGVAEVVVLKLEYLSPQRPVCC